MGIAREIYDLLLESNQENPFSEEMINNFLYEKLADFLYRVDGELSAQAHGRPASSKQTLQGLSWEARGIVDDLAARRAA